ncbi:hypothetical protein ACLKA6_009722 [Drosophila palustris]
MHQLAIDERDVDPIGSRALANKSSTLTILSPEQTQGKKPGKRWTRRAILARGQFKFRKWCSSHEKVLDGVAEKQRRSF